MSLNAPYSLVPETDAAIQISTSGTNPFWIEQQHTAATSHNAGKQQLTASNASAKADNQNRTEANIESNGNDSYIPPDTIRLAKPGTDSRSLNLDSAGVNITVNPEDIIAAGYPAPASSCSVTSQTQFNVLSQELDPLKQNESQRHSYYSNDQLTLSDSVVNGHSKKLERPQSLQVTAAGKPGVDSGPDHQGQKPEKGILKKSSGSMNFADTTVQISEGVCTTADTTRNYTLNDPDYSVGNTFINAHQQPDDDIDDDDTQQLIELEERLDNDREVESKSRSDHLGMVRKSPSSRRTLQRLKTELNLDVLAHNELELKANLFYHIGNPIKRWRVEKVVPVKLVLQLLKTFCLIVQVVLYTNTFPRNRAEFFYESREVFENLFFQNFNPENPRDFYSAFNAEDILSQFNYTVERYCALPNITIGGYDFAFDENNQITPVSMTLQQYASANFSTLTDTYVLDGTIVQKQFDVACGEDTIEHYINQSNDRFFNRFVELVISFPIKNMRVIHPEKVECYLFLISIHFKVEDNSGEVIYFLQEDHSRFNCRGEVHTQKRTFYLLYGALTVLDVIVLVLCVLSIYLTCSSLRRAYKLYRAMGGFYEKQLEIKLSWWDRRALFPIWHVINTISDLLITSGTVSKILLDFFVFDYSAPVRVLLGTAILFQAMVMLRYISYFKQLNALTRTVYLAFPELLKFLLCSGILFAAFALTGWIVLGPFHDKFKSMNSAIETLFGLLNGDDIYNTFIQIRFQDDQTAYVYSRIFLYVFLALFIYAVLNLFTSLIITAYEASQDWDTATRNEVRRFVFSGPLTQGGVALRDFGLTKKYVDPRIIKERKRTSLKKRISYRLRSRTETLTAQ